MENQVWGTGYGSKRHIPDERGIREQSGGRTTRRFANAACSPDMIFLEFFSDSALPSEVNAVMAKTSCVRCTKKAGAIPCVRCGGTGHDPMSGAE